MHMQLVGYFATMQHSGHVEMHHTAELSHPGGGSSVRLECLRLHISVLQCLRLMRNLLRYYIMPKRRWTPATSVGGGISTMAHTLVGSACSPLSVAMCPMNGTSCCLSLILSALSRSLVLHIAEGILRGSDRGCLLPPPATPHIQQP